MREVHPAVRLWATIAILIAMIPARSLERASLFLAPMLFTMLTGTVRGKALLRGLVFLLLMAAGIFSGAILPGEGTSLKEAAPALTRAVVKLGLLLLGGASLASTLKPEGIREALEATLRPLTKMGVPTANLLNVLERTIRAFPAFLRRTKSAIGSRKGLVAVLEAGYEATDASAPEPTESKPRRRAMDAAYAAIVAALIAGCWILPLDRYLPI